jgi:sugar fermentation stimulation protein A
MKKSVIKIEETRECRIVQRINRFVVHIDIEGVVCRAHINNTGRLKELMVPGRRAFCFPSPHTEKTDFRLFAVEESGQAALFDTQLQMKAFERALARGLFPWLTGNISFKRNARLGSSLIDYLIQCPEAMVYLEIKSAVLRMGSFASYPDCPSLRGQKHILELESHVRSGGRGIILFLAALPQVEGFRPDKVSDPALYRNLRAAQKTGLTVKAAGLFYSPEEKSIVLTQPDLPVDLT